MNKKPLKKKKNKLITYSCVFFALIFIMGLAQLMQIEGKKTSNQKEEDVYGVVKVGLYV